MGRRKQHYPKRTNEGSEEGAGTTEEHSGNGVKSLSGSEEVDEFHVEEDKLADDEGSESRESAANLLKHSMESFKCQEEQRGSNPEMAKLLQLQAAHGMAWQARMLESRQANGPLDLTSSLRSHDTSMAFPPLPGKLPRLPGSQSPIPFPFHLMSSNLSLPNGDLEKRILSEFKSFPGLSFPRFSHPGLLSPLNPYANLFSESGTLGKIDQHHHHPATMSALQRMSELAKTSESSGKHMKHSPGSWANRRAMDEANAEIFKCVWCHERYTTLADLTTHLKEAKHTSTMSGPTPATPTPPAMGSPPSKSSTPDMFKQPSKSSSPHSRSPKDGSPKEPNINVPRKLVRGQDVWLGKGQEQTRQILKCMWCGESFKSLADMTVHMQETKHYTKVISQEQLSSWRSSTGLEDKPMTPPIGSPPPSKSSAIPAPVLNCKICDKTFSSLKELGDHMVEDDHIDNKTSSGYESGSRKRPYVPKEKKKKSLSVRKLLELERNSGDGSDFEFKRSKIDLDPLSSFKEGSATTEGGKPFEFTHTSFSGLVGNEKTGKSNSILGSLEKMIETSFGNKKRSSNGSILQRCGIEESPEHPPPNGGGSMLPDPVQEYFKSQFAAAAAAMSKHHQHHSIAFKAGSIPMNMLHRLINEQKNMSVTKSGVTSSSSASSPPSGSISSLASTIHKSNDNDLTMKMKPDSSSSFATGHHHPLDALQDLCSEDVRQQRKKSMGEATEASLNLSSPSQDSFHEDHNNSSSSTASSPQPMGGSHQRPENKASSDRLSSLPMGRSQSAESPTSSTQHRDNEDGTRHNRESNYHSEAVGQREESSAGNVYQPRDHPLGEPDRDESTQTNSQGNHPLGHNLQERNFQIRKIIMNEEGSSESKFLKYSELARQLSGR